MNAPIVNTTTAEPTCDPKLAFLGRVASLHLLVEHGELDVVEAFDRVVEEINNPDLFQIVTTEPACDMCSASPCLTPLFCDACRKAEEARRKKPQPPPKPPRRVPICTVDAVKHCVRERGEAALIEPANIERLRRFDPQSLAEFDAWLQEKGYSRC